jgi:hypothetical protein
MNAHSLADSRRAIAFHMATLRRSAQSSKATIEALEAQRQAALQEIGALIRDYDDLLDRVLPLADAEDVESMEIIEDIRTARAAAFASMERHAPDEAFLWTPGMQADLRGSIASVEAGANPIYHDEESFLAALS